MKTSGTGTIELILFFLLLYWSPVLALTLFALLALGQVVIGHLQAKQFVADFKREQHIKNMFKEPQRKDQIMEERIKELQEIVERQRRGGY